MARAWYSMKKGFWGTAFDVCNHLFLILFALSIVYPFWTMLITSFSQIGDVTSLGLKIWIGKWSGAAYRFAFTKYGNVGVGYVNSVFRTVIGTIMVLSFTAAMAFPLSKRDLPFRNYFTMFLLITMFFSGGLIPTYLLVRTLGLIDNRMALILPGLVGGFSVIIMRNFMMTIDIAYEEAALMDGANYFTIITRVIIPLSKPVLAVVALWTAVGHWNEWFNALIYMRSESKDVLQLILRRMLMTLDLEDNNALSEFRLEREVELPSEALKAAVTMLTIGPIVLLYPFLQKYFIKGVFVGSLKG